MQTIEAAMPMLVEVQQHLRELPETMAELQAALVPLIEAADTLSRVARAAPRRSPRGRSRNGLKAGFFLPIEGVRQQTTGRFSR